MKDFFELPPDFCSCKICIRKAYNDTDLLKYDVIEHYLNDQKRTFNVFSNWKKDLGILGKFTQKSSLGEAEQGFLIN